MQNDDSNTDIYYKPYCRIPPYVMGMVLGYVIYQYFSKDFKLSWVRYANGQWWNIQRHLLQTILQNSTVHNGNDTGLCYLTAFLKRL